MVVLMVDEKVAMKVDHVVDMRDNLMVDELVKLYYYYRLTCWNTTWLY